MKLKFKTKPWEHQKKALAYLYKRDYGALFTDMGTGKTKVMIDLIQNRGFKRVLIVGTFKSCDVWEKEIAVHGFNRMKCLSLKGEGGEKRMKLLNNFLQWKKLDTSDSIYVILINYESIWREPLCNFFLRKTTALDCVICDESHKIKSPSSKASRYLTRLGKVVPHRYILTGTPVAESPLDIFAQYRFLDSSIFGTNYGLFRERYENIDVQASSRCGFPIRDKKNPYKNLDDLSKRMYSCAFFIESTVKLPEQVFSDLPFKMPKKVQSAYNELVKEGYYEFNNRVVSTDNALTSILRLQQLTSGFIPAEDEDGNTKVINVSDSRIKAFQELLEDFPKGEPIVVFANYRKDLKNIQKVCKELDIGYSELSGRKDTMNDWVNGKTQVIAVQYSSGSESIDLTRSKYCIYYSLTRKLSLYEQSKKRIHRPGQNRAVVYYHLIAKKDKGNTIDEIMLEALKQKKDVADYVMEHGLE